MANLEKEYQKQNKKDFWMIPDDRSQGLIIGQGRVCKCLWLRSQILNKEIEVQGLEYYRDIFAAREIEYLKKLHKKIVFPALDKAKKELKELKALAQDHERKVNACISKLEAILPVLLAHVRPDSTDALTAHDDLQTLLSELITLTATPQQRLAKSYVSKKDVEAIMKQNFPEGPKLIDKKRAAEALGIGVRQLEREIKLKKLRKVKQGRRSYIRSNDFLEYFVKHRKAKTEEE